MNKNVLARVLWTSCPYLDRFCSFPSSYIFCHQVINFVARCALMWLKPSDSQLITNTQIIHSIYMSKKK